MTAPIALFVYSRPSHTRQTLAALSANHLASESDLIVYSDAAKNDEESPLVTEVRDLFKSVSGFRSVTIVERESNYGLANNIIDGVTETCSRFGRVIVLEDDMIASPYFLTFMNEALEKYVNQPSIWHVSGWNYPIDPKGLGDAFFWTVMNCWGWATWADRWRYFIKDPDRLTGTWGRRQIRRFNLDGTINFWSQVKENQTGVIDTWAVFWYASIFEYGGLCLNPSISLVRNIGHDGTGLNCEMDTRLMDQELSMHRLSLPDTVIESRKARSRIKWLAIYQRLSKSYSRVLRKPNNPRGSV